MMRQMLQENCSHLCLRKVFALYGLFSNTSFQKVCVQVSCWPNEKFLVVGSCKGNLFSRTKCKDHVVKSHCTNIVNLTKEKITEVFSVACSTGREECVVCRHWSAMQADSWWEWSSVVNWMLRCRNKYRYVFGRCILQLHIWGHSQYLTHWESISQHMKGNYEVSNYANQAML